jgi:hypothetical protein
VAGAHAKAKFAFADGTQVLLQEPPRAKVLVINF